MKKQGGKMNRIMTIVGPPKEKESHKILRKDFSII